MILGVDTGGTFTDFVLFDGQGLRVHKRLSTPHAPEEAILSGIDDLDLSPDKITVIHGSTVATNAVLEGQGVRTVFITNHGLGDMLTIGRQARRELYNLQPQRLPPPVPGELCLETNGRISATGEIITPLSAGDLQQLKTEIQTLQPEAVAINLLFSFLDSNPEKEIEAIIPDDIFVSRSSAILPEYKEYERGITTWLNAWIGPLVERYLQRLHQGLPQAAITVMQSSGGTIAADQAGQLAVHMLLSGPAGGLAGARHIGQIAGHEQLLTFDMGGTSTDVALINGELRLTNEGHIGPYPVAVPMVDMHTIGAGGGSIAYLDDGGLLQVGPRSAGADPGPACYGRGGRHPTVTDANLVLGRLQANAFLGGKMSLDINAARNAINTISEPLNISIEKAAAGIISLANEHMAQALRVISIQRGIDPGGFTLMPFGGAGGLHVCALAEALGLAVALIPIHGGVLSALGMLVARRSREYSVTIAMLADAIKPEYLEQRFSELEHKAQQALSAEGIGKGEITFHRSVDMRYQGQAYTLNIPWTELSNIGPVFQEAHKQSYGHALERAIEVVNIRIQALGPRPEVAIPKLATTAKESAPDFHTSLYGIEKEVAVWQRQNLLSGQIISGPALITESVATTFIDENWQCSVDDYGNLLLRKTTQ